MQQSQDTPQLGDFREAIHHLALAITRNDDELEDLEQEMACQLLTLPPGQTRSWYLSRLHSRARNYWTRRMLDLPYDRRGRPVFDLQMIYVGGLKELDRLHQSRRAA